MARPSRAPGGARAEWSRASDDRSLLLRGSELRTAERWLGEQAAHAETATADQTRYIVASRDAATRRQRLTLAAVALALVVSIGLGVLAVLQRNEAQQQRNEARQQRDQALSLALAAGAVANVDTDPEESLLLATQALARSRETPARDALRQALGATHWRTIIRPRAGNLRASDIGGDGRLVVTADASPVVTLWDTSNGRPVRALRGDRAAVRSAELSPDGTRVVTAADDGSVRVWDARTGAVVGELPGAHDREVTDSFEPRADFSPDGTLVYATGQHVTTVWDLVARRVVAELSVPGEPFNVDVDISRDGRRVATTRELEDATQIWSLSHGRLLRTLHASISTARFGPDGRRIATGAGIDGPARVWDIRTGKSVVTLQPSTLGLDPVVFSPDGRKLVGVFLSEAYVLDARTGKVIARLRGHRDFISSAYFSPDSRRILTASQDGTARVWDAGNGRSVTVLRGHPRALFGAVYTRNGNTVATFGEDHTTRVWDLDSGALKFGTKHGASYANFTPDGRAVVDGVESEAIGVWDAGTGRELAELTAGGEELSGAVISPAGDLVATGLGPRIVLWSTRTWRHARTLEPLDDSIESLAFSRDGRRLVASSYSDTVRVADTATGRTVAETHAPDAEDVEFIRDGNEVVWVWDDTRNNDQGSTYVYGRVGSWDVRTGQRRVWYRHPEGSLSDLDLSGDGRRLVAHGPSEAVVFDVATRRRLTTVAEPDTSSGVLGEARLSPDGSRLVTANDDNVARIWDARSGRLVHELRGHSGSVSDASFSPHGHYVATIAEDGTGRIWDASSGRTVEVYDHDPDASLPTIQFAPHDERVLTADGSAARVVRCRLCAPLETQLRLAHRLVARSLTRDERRTYGLPAG